MKKTIYRFVFILIMFVMFGIGEGHNKVLHHIEGIGDGGSVTADFGIGDNGNFKEMNFNSLIKHGGGGGPSIVGVIDEFHDGANQEGVGDDNNRFFLGSKGIGEGGSFTSKNNGIGEGGNKTLGIEEGGSLFGIGDQHNYSTLLFGIGDGNNRKFRNERIGDLRNYS